MSTLQFTKMVATGNDFIMIDNRKNIIRNRANFSRKYCNRHFGIGGDGVIFIENAVGRTGICSSATRLAARQVYRTSSDRPWSASSGRSWSASSGRVYSAGSGRIYATNISAVDFRMRIFNPDGSEAEMCGNGARCAALFAYLKHIVKNPEMQFQTLSGIISATVFPARSRIYPVIARSEGVARYSRSKLKDSSLCSEQAPQSICSDQVAATCSSRVYSAPSSLFASNVRINMPVPADFQLHKKITIKRKLLKVHHINTGVPHTVLIYNNIDKIDIMRVAPPIRYHKAFPKGTNVDFIQIVNRHRIKMRTYERGVEAETFACGTGAVASAIISSLLGYTTSPVEVIVPGGVLKVYFSVGQDYPVCSGRDWSAGSGRTNSAGSGRVYSAYKSSKLDHYSSSKVDSTSFEIKDVFLEGEARVVYEGEI